MDATVGKNVLKPAPKINGKPVPVRVKFGVALLSQINTVQQTCSIKLYVDLVGSRVVCGVWCVMNFEL